MKYLEHTVLVARIFQSAYSVFYDTLKSSMQEGDIEILISFGILKKTNFREGYTAFSWKKGFFVNLLWENY